MDFTKDFDPKFPDTRQRLLDVLNMVFRREKVDILIRVRGGMNYDRESN